jgi:hypothetical protein
VPKYTAMHLARNHDQITKEQQANVQQYVDGLEDIAYDVSDVRFLGPDNPPYSEILVRYGGLRCGGRGIDGRRYGYVVGSTQMIQAHYKVAHG